MTLLIIILAMTNMALGYGLAIYLGQGQLPVQLKLGRFLSSRDAPPTSATQQQTPSETSVKSESAARGVSPESAIASEVSAPVAPEEKMPAPLPTKQLDLSDLMPGAQSASEAPPAIRRAETVSEPIANASMTEAAETPVDGKADPNQGGTVKAEAVAIEAEAIKHQPSPEVAIEKEVAAVQSDSAAAAGLHQEISEESEAKPTEVASAAEKSSFPPGAERTEEVESALANETEEEADTIDELETLAQQLQKAMAVAETSSAEETAESEIDEESVVVEAGEKPEEATPSSAPESAAEDLAADLLPLKEHLEEDAETVVTSPKSATPVVVAPSEVDESAVFEHALSGIESFQLQLQQHAKQGLNEAADIERLHGRANDARETEVATDEAEVLEGIELFRSQLANLNESADSRSAQSGDAPGDASGSVPTDVPASMPQV